ncbi:hypothetical protein AVEN_217713-1 [Araneus ventricosus]|uniref:Uncharacterized protein n=1 Tax=Araneus ventricosus TaxID=182803 RepID=A0A4Y2NLJ9_ARAVE|nr:hypothetical protein AVEN_217713-1 [Araneus ventricosus]
MTSKEEISVQNRFNTANELPQRVTEMKLQYTIVLYSIKLLPRRGRVMNLKCDHTSLVTCKQHSPCPFFPDLTPYDFFLWGYLKSKVCLGGVPTLTTIKDSMLWTVLSIPDDTLLSAVENVVYRMQCVVHEKGGHTERGLLLWCILISESHWDS